MRVSHCIWTLLLTLCAAGTAHAQAAAAAAGPEETRTYLLFVGGRPIGREALTVRTDADGVTLSGRGSVGAPVNLTTRQAEIRYRPDWTPESLLIEATLNGSDLSYRTTFADGVASSSGTDGGRPVPATQPIGPRTFVLPNILLSANEALGRWLADAGDTSGEFHALVAPGTDVTFRVAGSGTERMQTGTSTFEVRTYDLRFDNPAGETVVTLTTTASGELVRLNVPAQAVDFIREDLAAPTARQQTYSHPGDEQLMIPAAGFNLGATLTRPQGTNFRGRLPAVVLLSGSGANDRDGTAVGIPVIGQIAGRLADAGFLVVRYDKRGFGQSGGRSESATLSDFAEDARTVVNWLRRRDDVDPDRIGLVGHSEGAWVALLAAARERRVAAVVAIAAPSVTGAELVLEQQQHALDLINSSPAERQEKVALQKKLQEAVLTGEGWQDIPEALRRQADTPWFQSLLAFDPADVVKDVRQPVLLVHGALDRQVPVSHAERLAEIARTARRSRSVEVVTVPGVNHLLIPAVTGEVTEYQTLTDRTVSRAVTEAVAEWLTKSFAAVK